MFIKLKGFNVIFNLEDVVVINYINNEKKNLPSIRIAFRNETEHTLTFKTSESRKETHFELLGKIAKFNRGELVE